MVKNKIDISVVIPVYGCVNHLYDLVRRLETTLCAIVKHWEIILVNDACPQGSWEEIIKISESNDRVVGINLSRNFGQHNAIIAGLNYSKGDWIVVMDCDLQDRPEEINRLYSKAIENYDIVFARRIHRQDPFIRKISSHLFYKILGYLTDTRLDAAVANFGIYSRRVIQVILNMNESLRYFPVLIRWVGFRSTMIDVEHSKNSDKTSSYTWHKLFRLALDVMVSFSDKPLRLIIKTGLLIAILSIGYACTLIIEKVTGKVAVQGWASVMVSIWFLGGLLMIILGVLGIYIGKAFEEVKKRPAFIVEDIISHKDDGENNDS